MLVPLRYAAFPTEVRWSGDGHRFAWRMRMYPREGEELFVVIAPRTGERSIMEPGNYLTARQADQMMPRADMIWQMAQHLERRRREAGHGDVEVYAEIRKSLNGRAFQTFIDPAVDLTAVRYDLLGPDPWVPPLTTPFAPPRTLLVAQQPPL